MNGQLENSSPPREVYSAPGQRALLTALGDRCLLEFSLDAAGAAPPAAIRCEVLLQPADELGLAQGPPVLLGDHQVAPRASADGRQWFGHLMLPAGIDPELARQCYFRLSVC